MTQTMAERVAQDTTKDDSDSDVQEIAPPLLIQSRRKKRRRRYPREPIDRRFCRCSPRNKKGSEDNTNTSGSLPPPQELTQASYKQFVPFALSIIYIVNSYSFQCFN
jgi:hypothetical protein